jgi:hypothetical protein
MVIYFERNKHVDLPDKPLRMNVIEVRGHTEHDKCVAIGTLMQTVGIHLLAQGFEVVKRSHDEHSNDNDVSMTLFNLDGCDSIMVKYMVRFLVDSLSMLATEFNITTVNNFVDVHDF